MKAERPIDALLVMGKRIPDIDFPWPHCPVCKEPLFDDDGWFCEPCQVCWTRMGDGGRYDGEARA